MRTGRLSACVTTLALIAGFSCTAHSGEGARTDSKAQSANVSVADNEKKVSVSTGGASVEIKKSGEGSKSVSISANGIEVSSSNKGSEKAGDPAEDVVKIQGANHNQSYECKGRSFEVAGTSNTVNLTGDCQSLRVAGTANRVSVESVATINVGGIRNQVTWERGVNDKPPSISTSGIDNSVSKKSN